MSKRVRVLLADDHTVLRTALRGVLSRESDIQVVADVADGSEALRLARELAPDVVLMDIGMPGMGGIEATRQLLAAIPGVKVLALSTHSQRHFISQMLEAGASGYVLKSGDAAELLRGIRAVAQNRTYIAAEVASTMIDSRLFHKTAAAQMDRSRLSRRECQVLALIAEGKTSPEICAALHIAAGTVLAHRRNISRKLGLHSVAEQTKYAIREGLTGS